MTQLQEWNEQDEVMEQSLSEAPEKLKEYAELKKQIKALTEEAKMLEEDVLNYVLVENKGKYEAAYGRFTVSNRKKYKYSDAVIELEADVKKQKKIEEVSGVAEVVEEKPSLVFYAK